ncbi:MAG: choice-of-anchor Q domain-containing protein [Bacteroidota bacterium]
MTANQSPVTGMSNTSVSKALTGLTPNTTYHFSAVGVNSAGTSNGLDATFSTPCLDTITVTNVNDSGAGSLRQALIGLCTGGTISFDASVFTSATPRTITLASGITLDKSLTLDGPGADVLAISGGNTVRPFTINSGITVVIQDVTIRQGRWIVGGGISNDGTLTIKNSTLTQNIGTSAGGGISNSASGNLTLQDSILSGNTAQDLGGAIENYGTLKVQNSTLSGNSVGAGSGGALDNSGDLTVQNSILSGNTAQVWGGAIYNTGTLTMLNSTLSENTADRGGGIFIQNSSPTLTNLTINNNSAVNFGGGLYIYGSPTLTNLTIIGNSATENGGGGIYNYTGNANINNNILWGNTLDGIFVDTGNINIANSIVQDTSQCGGAPCTDPLLGTPGKYGGATNVFPLLPGSLAIDAGSACPTTDQRGVTRGASCDIGAFESGGFTLSKTGGDDQSTTVGTAFADALTMSIAAQTAGEPVDGGVITSTAPASGASSSPVFNKVSIASGAVSQSLTANATAGNYTISAGAAGAESLSYHLSNSTTATVTTNAATGVTSSGATLNGTVNAGNDDACVTFEYGLTDSYGTTLTATPGIVTGASDTAVSTALTGLALNSTYHYRVVATNSAGTTNGLDKTFTTGKVAPTATTDAATDVTSTEATLNGTVNAGNDDTSVTFEYGLTDSYGTTLTATPGTVTGTNDTAVSTTLTELAMNSTYHYRVVAVNSAGTTKGEDETFTTTSVSITSEIHDAKHKLILSAAIGDSLHASATVTGNAAGTPTGTLRFTTFDNTSCTGSGLNAGTVTLDSSGKAHPSAIQTLSANGHAFKAHYNGDATYAAADGECQAISNSPYPTVLVLASSTVPADGTELKLGPTQLLVQFNQNMWHSSTVDPHAVQNPQNYLLVEAGRNQVFDTLACGPVGVGGLKPDDHVVKVDSVTYDAETFKATLKINGGQKLPNGSYRLFICGTTSIADATDQEFLNNHLKDSLVSFSVVPASSGRKTLPKTGFAPYVVSRLPVQAAGMEYNQSGMWLEIHKLGVLLPVVGVPQQTGWDVTWLGNQAGYLEGTAFPTWNGNSVITGHVTGADGQPGAFAGLSGLAWGDEVVIHAWGQRYVFAVRSVDDTVNPEDTRLLDQHEVLPWITLLTCRGYDEQSDTYRWRTAVRAVLVSVLNEDSR